MDGVAAVEELRARPVRIEEASWRVAMGGVPSEAGLYAWWVRDGCLPEVPRAPHPTLLGWGALYVGRAPTSPSSAQTLRSRVLGQHVSGNTGSSTFRYSLASLLGYRPKKRGAKYVLSREDNDRLSRWQRDNLLISWAVRPRPWEVEAEVIARLGPPLNLADNDGHPFHATMSAARARFRQTAVLAARPGPDG